MSWAFGDKSTAALLGPSGERVAHASLRAASPLAGFRLEKPDGGQVRRLLGELVEGGPLDSAAYLPTVRDTGIPGPTAVVPIEVKNRRGWIYPSTNQLYQLLFKASAMQTKHPDQAIAPVLICRRHHYTTQSMAADLGFFIISAKNQFIGWGDRDIAKLEEVRTELGYLDLINHEGTHSEVEGYLARGLPKVVLRTAERWTHFGPPLIEHFRTLRKEIAEPGRSSLMSQLRASASELGAEVDW